MTLQRVAVDERGVAVPCRRDAELIHDPGRHAGRRVLGPAGELGEFERGAVEPEGERDGDLEGGTRRQAGADRDAWS